MPRRPRPPVPPDFQPWLASFTLALRADGKSTRTVDTYVDAAGWLAGWLGQHHPDIDDWAAVTRDHIRLFFVDLREFGYADGYVNHVGRALQAYFKWFSTEEEVPNLFGDKLRPPPPPKMGSSPPPVLAVEQMARLLKDAESGRDYESRRDAALIRLFAATGGRLSEIALLEASDVDVTAREARVTGKGGKQRTVKFDHRCAVALDRYLRLRVRHKAVKELGVTALWIGLRRTVPMTKSGVYQVLRRRGEAIGIKLWPHMMRHSFAHNWLDAGGAEGDLMELAGWDSAQMLKLYGRSAAAARARRSYDRVNVMGGL